MSININDQFTLDAAFAASAALKTVEGLLAEAERLIAKAESECDVDMEDAKVHLADLQSEVVSGANTVNKSIASYTGNPDYYESPETTGRY